MMTATLRSEVNAAMYNLVVIIWNEGWVSFPSYRDQFPKLDVYSEYGVHTTAPMARGWAILPYIIAKKVNIQRLIGRNSISLAKVKSFATNRGKKIIIVRAHPIEYICAVLANWRKPITLICIGRHKPMGSLRSRRRRILILCGLIQKRMDRDWSILAPTPDCGYMGVCMSPCIF